MKRYLILLLLVLNCSPNSGHKCYEFTIIDLANAEAIATKEKCVTTLIWYKRNLGECYGKFQPGQYYDYFKNNTPDGQVKEVAGNFEKINCQLIEASAVFIGTKK